VRKLAMSARTAAKAPAERRFPIAREGYPWIAGSACLAAAAWPLGLPALAAVGLGLALVFLGFFRDPERTAPDRASAIVAPADGRVLAVEEWSGEPLAGVRVSIFMSPLDVHVNRCPIGGRVEAVRYRPGKFFRAFAKKASSDNEQNAVVLCDARGRSACYVQIAGFLARRIVCYVTEGMAVERGQRCGMIVFGSRVDVYLPREVRLQVCRGDRVRAGESVIAEWPS